MEVQAGRSSRDAALSQVRPYSKFRQNSGQGNGEKWDDCFNDRTDLIWR